MRRRLPFRFLFQGSGLSPEVKASTDGRLIPMLLHRPIGLCVQIGTGRLFRYQIGPTVGNRTCPLIFVDRPGPILEATDIIDFVVPHVLELFASKS